MPDTREQWRLDFVVKEGKKPVRGFSVYLFLLLFFFSIRYYFYFHSSSWRERQREWEKIMY